MTLSLGINVDFDRIDCSVRHSHLMAFFLLKKRFIDIGSPLFVSINHALCVIAFLLMKRKMRLVSFSKWVESIVRLCCFHSCNWLLYWQWGSLVFLRRHLHRFTSFNITNNKWYLCSILNMVTNKIYIFLNLTYTIGQMLTSISSVNVLLLS